MAAIMAQTLATTMASGLSTELAALALRVQASVALVRSGRGGAGSGVIWRADGLVVTNHHVATSDQAELLLADGTRLRGRVVARDEALDLAAIETSATGLAAAQAGDSLALRAGEIVLAVGNPLGARGAAAVGIVTGVGPLLWGNRHVGWEQREYVQSDVELLPGNSGGALADAQGRVVGIPTMVTSLGLALAVPTHVVARFLRVLDGERRELGVEARWVTLPAALAKLGPAGARSGLLVVDVRPSSLAERAGLMTGDILVGCDDVPLPSAKAVEGLLEQAARTGRLELDVLRGGVRRSIAAAVAA
jgi:serine protease Do